MAFKMITISKQHYEYVLDLLRQTAKNLTLLTPNSEIISQVQAHFETVNSKLQQIYHQISRQLKSLIDSKGQFEMQNRELNEKIITHKKQLKDFETSSSHQRTDLAKSQTQINKYKEMIKNLKEGVKGKLNEKDSQVEEYSLKYKKYKRLYTESSSKIGQMEKKLIMLEVDERLHKQETQLDQEMIDLESQLNELNLQEQ